MFCKSCGARVRDTARFCPECGTPVPSVSPESSKTDENSSSSAPSPYGVMYSSYSAKPVNQIKKISLWQRFRTRIIVSLIAMFVTSIISPLLGLVVGFGVALSMNITLFGGLDWLHRKRGCLAEQVGFAKVAGMYFLFVLVAIILISIGFSINMLFTQSR